MTTDTTNTTAPDAEALLSTVETAGAALVAALRACEAAGIPAGVLRISDAGGAASTTGIRAWLAERDRPKGPMATVTRSSGGTFVVEVEKITDARIILRNGYQFARGDGYRVGAAHLGSKWGRSRIASDEVARIVATGWTPPKAPRASKAAK